MMTMITTPAKKNLSDIDNIEDLKSEINALRRSVKMQEEDLAIRLNKLPHETMKATVGSVVPVVVKGLVSRSSIGIISTVLGLVLGKKTHAAGVAKSAGNVVKKLGVITLLKGTYALWKRQKQKRENPV